MLGLGGVDRFALLGIAGLAQTGTVDAVKKTFASTHAAEKMKTTNYGT